MSVITLSVIYIVYFPNCCHTVEECVGSSIIVCLICVLDSSSYLDHVELIVYII